MITLAYSLLYFLGSAILVYVAVSLLEIMTDEQRDRNAYLQSEIQQLETQIAEIKKITERKRTLNDELRLF